jgi:hypothetical protein
MVNPKDDARWFMAHIDSINCRREYVHWGCADQVVDLCDESGPMAASSLKTKTRRGFLPTGRNSEFTITPVAAPR